MGKGTLPLEEFFEEHANQLTHGLAKKDIFSDSL